MVVMMCRPVVASIYALADSGAPDETGYQSDLSCELQQATHGVQLTSVSLDPTYSSCPLAQYDKTMVDQFDNCLSANDQSRADPEGGVCSDTFRESLRRFPKKALLQPSFVQYCTHVAVSCAATQSFSWVIPGRVRHLPCLEHDEGFRLEAGPYVVESYLCCIHCVDSGSAAKRYAR